MAKKTKTKTTTQKGKKGGISAISPEMVGAMTGAAIGGVAGLMLANKKTRDNLAVVKDRALESAGDVLKNVHLETNELRDSAKDAVSEATNRADKKISKSLPKNIK